MIVEVLAVGTELLIGQIVNTNAAAIGEALAEAGLDAHYQTVVGDNAERIAAALRTCLARSDAVVITGGIGPTQDDLTREGVCLALGRDLVFSDDYADELRRRWAARGVVMPESNLRQASYPAGAELLPNPKGTAPGLYLVEEGKPVLVVPGVPQEMEGLLQIEVIPRLKAAAVDAAAIVSRVLRIWGRSESQLAEMVDDLYTGSSNPSLAFLASGGEIRLRLTAKAASREGALDLIGPLEAELRGRLGSLVFAFDGETVERVLFDLLETRGWTIGTAESATGGMVASRLTSIPGSSRWFRGSVVAYGADLKETLLGIHHPESLVDEETAVAMAHGALKTLGVEVALAVTGSAGPEPLEKPPGTMVVGVATPEGERARTLRLPGDRERVRTYAATAALHLGRLAVAGEWWS